jgi:hypothetical protein
VRSDRAGPEAGADPTADRALALEDARRIREASGTDVGFAVHAIPRESDTRVVIGVVLPDRALADEKLAFQRGGMGADRAAIAGTAVLLAAISAAG